MNVAVDDYIKESFQKLHQLRMSEKGEVWLASDKSGKLVVIKKILLTGLPYKKLKENPQPIAPKVIYCSERDDETLVIEEYVQGETLLERLEQGRYFTEKEAAQVLMRLCDGLYSLHKQGIIHRDIKPSNLILQNGGIIRLIDFDAARIVKEDKNEDTRFLGTKGYAPPEQFGYGQTDERSDIYSVGITIKKMLGKEYLGYLNNILDKCTEIDPKKRYVSVMALKKDILWQRRKIFRYMLSAFFLAVSLGIAFYLTRLPEVPSTVMDDAATTEPAISDTNLTAEPQTAQVQQNLAEDSLDEKEIQSNSASQTEISVPNFRQSEEVQPKIQQPIPIPEPLYERPLETSFSLNGNIISSTQTDIVSLDRSDWGSFHANLHVENNSGRTWENPSIRIIFQDNHGGKFSEVKSLPPIAVGAAADFSIPVGSYSVARSEIYSDTSAWLQVYLDNGNLKATESYWCVEFNLRENENVAQDDAKT